MIQRLLTVLAKKFELHERFERALARVPLVVKIWQVAAIAESKKVVAFVVFLYLALCS